MPRDMSYRKPVPIYIPSPPSSPALSPSIRLSLVLDDYMPPLPNDWRDIIEQALTDGSDSFFMADEVLIGRPVHPELSQENRTPSTSHHLDHQTWSEYRSATRSASCSPANPDKPRKRKLPQHYRPPTPPLPTHYKRQELLDNELQLFGTDLPSVGSEHVQEHRCPTPRRESSMKAGSFWTKSPSFKTENTYSSFGISQPSVLFSGSFATYPGLGATGLPVLPMQPGRNETNARTNSTSLRLSISWRGHLESWNTSLKVKLRSFTRMFIC